MSSQFDLFVANNIFVPIKKKQRKNIVCNNNIFKTSVNESSIVKSEQIKFSSIDVVSLNPSKVDSDKIKHHERVLQKREYRKSPKYKETTEKNWHVYLFDRMKASIRTRNTTAENVYQKALIKYNNAISNGLFEVEPIMKDLYGMPDFDSEFLLKLWDIQEGRDAYTNQKMIISSKLAPFKPSCDRIDSDVNYIKGNVVLCCYSTNTGKHKFDLYADEENSWLNYISDGDPTKKQEILERIKRIQTLSME